jgi:hypothetical protein
LLADKHRPRCGFSVEMCLSWTKFPVVTS